MKNSAGLLTLNTMKKLSSRKVYRFEAAGVDIYDRRDNTPENGTLVRLTQPYGCPRNGTMGHYFVADAETNEFIGLVSGASLIENN